MGGGGGQKSQKSAWRTLWTAPYEKSMTNFNDWKLKNSELLSVWQLKLRIFCLCSHHLSLIYK